MSFSGKRPDLLLLYLNSPCLKVKYVTNKNWPKQVKMMSFSGKRPDLLLLYLNCPCLKVKHVTNKKLAKTGQNDEF